MPRDSCLNPLAGLALISFVTVASVFASSGLAPGLDDLANATYPGLEGAGGAITLTAGKWQGDPWVEGGAVVPSAGLVGDLLVQADLDQDGRTESINLVRYSGGGTGQFMYLAASRFEGETVDVFATAPVGDRAMVRGMRAAPGVIEIDLVQAGPNDGACCPGDVVTRAWRLQPEGLEELPAYSATQRLSPAILAGLEWRLDRWSHDEPVDEDMLITLAWVDGKFVGESACNRYFADVSSGQGGADSLVVSGVGSTRMACIDELHAMAESRFLSALDKVNRLYFLAGDLVLYWGEDSEFGGLYFKPVVHTDPEAPNR